MEPNHKLTDENIREICDHVEYCARRLTASLPHGVIEAEDLAQDYYLWLAQRPDKYNPAVTMFRMIDFLRTYTHYDRTRKKTPLHRITIPDKDDHPFNPLVNQPDTSSDALTVDIEREHAESIINHMLLDRQHRRILELIYCDGLNQKEAADSIGLSPSRVCQIHQEALPIAKEYYIRKVKTDEVPQTQGL
jgi:RNA polymerase sigma factor (sigma-70 family)